MRKKLVFFIALALALTQGLAAQDPIGSSATDLTTEYFTTYVGQQDTRTITLVYTYKNNNPDYPVAMPKKGQEQSGSIKGKNDYSVTIEGDNPEMFSDTLIRVMEIGNNLTGEIRVSATIDVTYSPTASGTHQATVYLRKYETSVASQKLMGEATYMRGDVNCDGQVNVADVTDLIDYLLSGDDSEISLEAADVDGDGKVSVGDVSELIDIILGVPDMKLCTYLIVTKTDGTLREFLIDDYTKINIVKPNLVIRYKRNGSSFPRTVTYSLDDLAQLSYEERMVTYDKNTLMLLLSNEQEDEDMIEVESETLNTMQP